MTTLAGRYRLQEVIGRGGMSTVYRATDRVLQRTVAVKVMTAALAEGDPSYIARFEREARAAASLSHPGIVTVYDTGVDQDMHFIAMEYVDGETLAELIHREAPLEPERTARIGAAVADALEAAHEAGLVHRDIKPGNVMIARDGTVKVLDFGIARARDAATITRTGSVLGAMPYMPPEHARGEPVDARADLYSLGCVLYEMLTGERPFRDVTAAIFQQQSERPPRPPSEVNPRVGSGLDALVLQMLSMSPGHRPQSAAEVRDRLLGPPSPGSLPADPAQEREGTAATRILGAGAAVHGPPPGRARDSVWIRYAGAVLTIGVVALIAVLALASGGSRPSSASSSTTPPSSTSSTSRSASTPTTRSAPARSTSTTTPTQTVTTTTTTTTTAPAPPSGPGAPGPAAPAPPGKAHGKKHGGG